MPDQSPKGLELTPSLSAYAKDVASAAAKRLCGPRISRDDAASEAMLQLLRALPKYPSRGAAPTTWIHMVVHSGVLKYAQREQKKLDRLRSFDGPSGEPTGPTANQETALERWHGCWSADRTTAAALVEEALDLIDSEESKRMWRLLIEHGGNRSAVASEMGLSEGAVRQRLKVLAPKLLAAGFDPFSTGGAT
jgi:RNA polymerase sigma factor (sigma-70 family)